MIATSIASMVSELTRPKSALPANKVSWQVYKEWQHSYLFDALRSLSYGQSFCNKFGLADNILYFERNVDMADTYIMLHYVDHARP